jgi:hypothetical protein
MYLSEINVWKYFLNVGNPVSNPTMVSYKASGVKINSATSSLVRFINKKSKML